MLKRLPQTSIAFGRTRFILYSITFLTSLISILFSVAAILHHLNTLAKDPSYQTYVYGGDPSLAAVAIIPLLWSAVWSFIVLRNFLQAINHSSSSSSTTNPTPTIVEPTISISTPDPHPLPPRPRRKCCCCCHLGTPWLSRTSGPHPNLSLPIELLLWLSLVLFGFWFAIFPSYLFSRLSSGTLAYRTGQCPTYWYKDRSKLQFYCSDEYGQVLGLEAVAQLGLVLNLGVHFVLFVLACVGVHRWRGLMGVRRSGRGRDGGLGVRKMRGRGSARVVGDGVVVEEEGGWIEMRRGKDGVLERDRDRGE